MFEWRTTMRAKQRLSSLGRAAKSALAAVLIVLLLLVSSLSVCPALHHMLHHDADDQDHACLITDFAKGQVDTAETAPIVVFFLFSLLCAAVAVVIEPLPSFDYRLSPSRAPPGFLS